MRGHRQDVFERAVDIEVSGDAGRPERMAAEFSLQAGLVGALPWASDAMYRAVRQHAALLFVPHSAIRRCMTNPMQDELNGRALTKSSACFFVGRF